MNPTVLDRKQALAHVKNMLIQKIRELAAKDKFIPYTALDDHINADVRKHYRGTLNTVRKILVDDYGILLDTVPKKGFNVVSDAEKARLVGEKSRKKIVGVTNDWRHKHDSVDTSKLTTSESVQDYARECLKLSVQEDINSGRQAIQIEAALETALESREARDKNLNRILHAANEALKDVG